MLFDLSDDHRLIQETVRDFARNEVAPVAEELDREKRFPYEIVAKLGELGLMGIPFPEEYGGAGGDSLAYAIAVEELTRVGSSVAITRGVPVAAPARLLDFDPPGRSLRGSGFGRSPVGFPAVSAPEAKLEQTDAGA